jgi:hypothetical protein
MPERCVYSRSDRSPSQMNEEEREKGEREPGALGGTSRGFIAIRA